jgi:hypothetical protein
VVVGAHGVDVIVLGDEPSMTSATRYLSDSNIIRAKPWHRIIFLSIRVFASQAQAQLAVKVSTPREYFGVEFFVLLSVDV